MKTPGPIRVQLLLLTTLTLSSVTSTGLQIFRMVGNTSEENTSYRSESLEVAKDGLRLRVTGKSTKEVLQSLKKTLSIMERTTLEEKS